MPYKKQAGLPLSSMFQIDLTEILTRRRADLGLHDKLIQLVKDYSRGSQLVF